MSKTQKITYWIATAWLCLALLSSGLVQLLHIKEEVAFILDLGYPSYFLNILGVSKLLAVVVLLMPGLPLLKEWAYAGITFTMLGALYAHLVMHNGMADIGPVLLILTLTALSWCLRPAGRKLVSLTTK